MKSEASLWHQVNLRKVALQRSEFRILKGRGLVWMVLDFFKLNTVMAPYYGYPDIGCHTWKGMTTLRCSLASTLIWIPLSADFVTTG